MLKTVPVQIVAENNLANDYFCKSRNQRKRLIRGSPPLRIHCLLINFHIISSPIDTVISLFLALS